MILILKEYYPDYNDNCDCGCSSGTETIEHVYDIETDLPEALLVLEYNNKLEEMVKGHKDYKEKNTPLKFSRMKSEIARNYSFEKYLLTEYKNKEVKFIVC